MLSVLPLPIVISDITTTGSPLIDFLGLLSIGLYDFVAGTGSSVGSLLTIPFSS